MKLRLILRNGIADIDGKLAEYEYLTRIVEIEVLEERRLPEVIGGEWLQSDQSLDNKAKEKIAGIVESLKSER